MWNNQGFSGRLVQDQLYKRLRSDLICIEK
jgi:hypothetical protein